MSKRVLITGGAGFIGSHVADRLLRGGYEVRILDVLSEQVHGTNRELPDYLADEVEILRGDIRDPAMVERALHDVDIVHHFAAAVGVGQSMYEIARYTSVNNGGTACLLEALIKHPVERLVVASSMSIYGEGLYSTRNGDRVAPEERTLDQLRRQEWELMDADGQPLTPMPTPETRCPTNPSIYALSKYDQERMCLAIGRAYAIPTVALRFFNVYGPRQALSNPYTGVLAIFASRLMNDQPPLINEDGGQRRDFVNVRDVAHACMLASQRANVEGMAFNIGSGKSITVHEIAERLGQLLEKTNIEPEVTGKYRKGDIRHCFADITLAGERLDYRPEVPFEDGLIDLAEWLEGRIAVDHVPEAQKELISRGLAV